MREWEEYCNDGWMFLNKRPTMMCLAKKKKKKQLKEDKLQHNSSVHVLLVNIFSRTRAPIEEQINRKTIIL